jgi:uncharacterized iron-regulated protein
MKKLQLFIVPFAILLFIAASDKPAYKLYNEKGKEVKYKKLLKSAQDADIILFGELHNNPISHWLQLELTQDLHDEKGDRLILGAEMFESDNQILIDEYFAGQIRQRNFKDEVRLWKNYDTDYEPLLEFANENGIPFIATNIPRRYASAVFKGGFEALDSLSEQAKGYIAPLPPKYDPELKNYKTMLEQMGGPMAGHGGDNLPKAQAIKDATMAHFILQNWEKGDCFLHFNGDYHSRDREGIVWYLLQENPNLQILTISTVEQVQMDSLTVENTGRADYTLCIPATMTKTH